MQVRERAPALVEPQSVAGEELVRNREPDVPERDVVDESAIRSIEKRHRREVRRTPKAERLAEEMKSQARVDHVLDDEDMTIGERCVDVLQQAHTAVLSARIRSQLDDVECVRDWQFSREICEKHDARFQRGDQDRVKAVYLTRSRPA